ncbi:hypothetical protein KIN20_014804 [Parelaphostrongylus tenuis]|uniref:Uncharacterized protein n=1 Tax=Parelaphostrongylus tenuis TaxID=148309 RepID=A0AAD5ME26_PARTN|nr:hypothetical protein KIN20_012248 [Parelaphostrongylus tenuis]KAJ1356894.1 hypothetical protein KIN20_014745 [Parelaphostrongylus tenuis]KAJ1356895.1 hypothetical protein KIN20_014804 [Parelaphostrongylus tenuis]
MATSLDLWNGLRARHHARNRPPSWTTAALEGNKGKMMGLALPVKTCLQVFKYRQTMGLPSSLLTSSLPLIHAGRVHQFHSTPPPLPN